MMKVKITSKGFSINGKCWPAYLSYSESHYAGDRGGAVVDEPSIMLSVKSYASLPAGFAEALGAAVKNGSDPMTDYFDNDRVKIPAGHPRFREAVAAYLKKERSWLTRKAKQGRDVTKESAHLDEIERRHLGARARRKLERAAPETARPQYAGSDPSRLKGVGEAPTRMLPDLTPYYNRRG